VKRAVDEPWSGGSRRARKLNGMGETRLHIAARLNKLADVVTLLMEGADINARDYAGIYAVFDTPHCRGRHRNFYQLLKVLAYNQRPEFVRQNLAANIKIIIGFTHHLG